MIVLNQWTPSSRATYPNC